MDQLNKNTAEGHAEGPLLARRTFLQHALGLMGWGAFTVWAAGLSAAGLRYFIPRIRYEPPTTFKVGRAEDYLKDSVDSRWLKERGIFLVRNSAGMYAMKAMCTHLGCNITWFGAENRFKCPCHGSFFDLNGDVIGGPAPEPLYRTAIRLDSAGNIVVDIAQMANKPGHREKGSFLLKV